MKTSEILKAAWAKIDSPEKWTTGAFARNELGQSVLPTDPKATCFCSLGALNAVRKESDHAFYNAVSALRGVAMALGPHDGVDDPVVGVNDFSGYLVVKEMFADAIAKAEEQEASDESR